MRRPAREQQDYWTGWEQPRRGPLAVRHAPALAVLAARVPAAVRRAARSAVTEAVVFVMVAAALAAYHHVSAALIPAPNPPAGVCGNSSILDGPSSAPPGAVTVPAGDNSAVFGSGTLPANTTYWLAPGTHTILHGTFGQFSGIAPGSNDVIEGGPGAVLDGQGYNFEAIDNPAATGVTVEYLTVQNFNTPGGQGAVYAFTNWTIQYDTIQDTVPGSGLYLGTNDVAQYNCITLNGQQGFAAFGTADVSPLTKGVQNVTVDHNEISFNDTCNWEADSSFPVTPPAGCAGAGQFSGCGCSGAGKFWETNGSFFEDNYVHDDYSAGAWWDTNDTGATIDGNYFAREYAVPLIYEISYNALITGNVFVDNAWGVGPANPGFPSSAIYINGSGSDSRVAGPYGGQFAITGNTFVDNWGGVVLYETADRFCTSVANTSTGTCTLVNPGTANLTTCATSLRPPSGPARAPVPPGRRTRGTGGTGSGQGFQRLINTQPYYSDCRWKTRDVLVSGNTFSFNAAHIGASCTLANWCGFNGLFSNFGITPPYLGFTVADAITFSQGNLFAGNTYCGPWQFDPHAQGTDASFATWQAAPYNQDPGSTVDGPACTQQPVTYPPGRGPQNRPVTIPIRTGRR